MDRHEQLIDRAAEYARQRNFELAREIALEVVREDARNVKALWIVANVTASLTERRNVLNALLRVHPDNPHARAMLNTVNEQLRVASSNTSTVATGAPRVNVSPLLLFTVFAAAAALLAVMVLVNAL